MTWTPSPLELWRKNHGGISRGELAHACGVTFPVEIAAGKVAGVEAGLTSPSVIAGVWKVMAANGYPSLEAEQTAWLASLNQSGE